VQLIDTDVRNDWFELTRNAKLGLKQLRLNAMTTALEEKQRELTGKWISQHLSADERESLWTVADYLSNVSRSNRESRDAAADLPLVPRLDGRIIAPKEAISAQPGECSILLDGGFQAPLLD